MIAISMLSKWIIIMNAVMMCKMYNQEIYDLSPIS